MFPLYFERTLHKFCIITVLHAQICKRHIYSHDFLTWQSHFPVFKYKTFKIFKFTGFFFLYGWKNYSLILKWSIPDACYDLSHKDWSSHCRKDIVRVLPDLNKTAIFFSQTGVSRLTRISPTISIINIDNMICSSNWNVDLYFC